MRGALLPARWFDGRSSQEQPVLVRLVPTPRGPDLHWHLASAPEQSMQRAHDTIEWPERFSRKRPPRQVLVDLGEQGSLAFDDATAWHQAYEAAGGRISIAGRMQTRWTVFATVLVATVVLLTAFYRWGTPWAATQIARHVPLSWERQLSQRALADIDRFLLKPSTLPAARQEALRQGFASLARQLTPELQRYAGYAPPLELHFRRGMGANAFALPGGTVVLTDGLVEAAAKAKLADEAIVGVLAHEIGHVVHRHTTRMLVEQGVLNVGLGLALGDVSWAFANASSLLTALAYRRSHETEADCFASRLMRRAGLPTQPMGQLLMQIDPDAPAAAEFISSHPATPERARKLAEGGNACEP
jgi:Zn-dependent protease with chaperone function